MYSDFMFDVYYNDDEWEIEDSEENGLDAFGNKIEEFPW